MGVEINKRQVANPYTQDAAGTSVDFAQATTGTAATITITRGTNYTVTSDIQFHWEIMAPSSVSITAATASSPLVQQGNYYFPAGTKISLIKATAAVNGTVWLVPSND